VDEVVHLGSDVEAASDNGVYDDDFEDDTPTADHGRVDEVVHLGSDVETASDNTTLKIPSRTPHMPPLLHTSCLLLF